MPASQKDIMARSEEEWRTYIANNQRKMSEAIEALTQKLSESELARCKECGVTEEIARIAQTTALSLAKGEMRMDEQDKAIAHNTTLTNEAVANSKQIIDLLTTARVGSKFVAGVGKFAIGLAGIVALWQIKWPWQ